jgi:signal peptidase I
MGADKAVPPKAERAGKSPARHFMESLGLAFCFYMIVANYAVAAYEIPSGSMLPTLRIGDRVLVNRSSYDLNLAPARLRVGAVDVGNPLGGVRLARLSDPRRGDIIVFHLEAVSRENLIKRVIGLPGETIEVRAGKVHVQGRALADPWAHHLAEGRVLAGQADFGPATVPPGHYFVMGDNRDNSYDSRFWFAGRGGFVPRESILGRALVIYWPGEGQEGEGERWSHLGLLNP